jgi:hypothetical protein
MNFSKLIGHFTLCIYAWGLIRLTIEKGSGAHRFALFAARLESSLPLLLADSFYSVSLRVSLPLAIWLSSGWLGVLVHWKLIASPQRLLEDPQPALASLESRHPQ